MGWLTRLLPHLDQDALWKITESAYEAAPRYPFKLPHLGIQTPVKTFGCPLDPRTATVQQTHRRLKVALSSYLGVMGVDYRTPEGTKDRHSQAANFAVGASITSALSLLRLRYAGWPLHPVGFLLANSYPMQRIWFSIFLGWLLKVLIVRFGGASLFRSARPVFIGLIIGEASGAAFWLVVSLLRLSMGLEYRAINLLPT